MVFDAPSSMKVRSHTQCLSMNWWKRKQGQKWKPHSATSVLKALTSLSQLIAIRKKRAEHTLEGALKRMQQQIHQRMCVNATCELYIVTKIIIYNNNNHIMVRLIPYHETSHEHLNSITTFFLPDNIILAVLVRETPNCYPWYFNQQENPLRKSQSPRTYE